MNNGSSSINGFTEDQERENVIRSIKHRNGEVYKIPDRPTNTNQAYKSGEIQTAHDKVSESMNNISECVAAAAKRQLLCAQKEVENDESSSQIRKRIHNGISENETEPSFSGRNPEQNLRRKSDSETSRFDRSVPRYILSTKGHKLLAYGDYIFRKKSGNATKSYWICAYDRGFKCRARLRLVEGSDPPEIIGKSGEHNHGREFGRVEAREIVNSMKQRAMNGEESLEHIYNSSITEETLTDEGLVALATKQALKAAMRRVRRKKRQSHFAPPKEVTQHQQQQHEQLQQHRQPQQHEQQLQQQQSQDEDSDTPLDLSMKSKRREEENNIHMNKFDKLRAHNNHIVTSPTRAPVIVKTENTADNLNNGTVDLVNHNKYSN